MVKRPLFGLAFAMIANSAVAATESECWDDWYAKRIALQPTAEATIDPRTGKQLSQTDGAKRSRAKKVQALKDELELRSKKDAQWLAYRAECVR